MTPLLLVTLLASLVGLGGCAKILAVLPFPSKSHSMCHYAIFRTLAQRGHEIQVFSTFPPSPPIDNVTYFHLHNDLVDIVNSWTFEEFRAMSQTQYFFGFGVKGLWELGNEVCRSVFKNEKIIELIQSKEHFDLVFIEPTLSQESMLVFGDRFKAPVVNFQGFGTWSLIDWVTGNALPISHIPESLSFSFSNNMSFKERFQNFFSTVLTFLFYHYNHLPTHERIIGELYKGPKPPPLTDMLKNISITLTNSYSTMEYPRPYPPNVIPIAGVHMSSHVTPLPQNIKKFMDEAKDGVILFSLGTVVPAHILPKESLQAFVNAFRKIPKKVLWKIELDTLPGLSDNVMLTKWVPQQTVLAHPNCVLFMTHGGLFSQHEVLHAGVPVVGIPFFAEQPFNVRFYEHLGVGVELDFFTVTEESVYKAVTTVLNDKRYRENAKRVSKIVRDQVISGVDSAVFWVEYVLRHGGAAHLRPASAQLRWYQLFLIDIVTVLLIPLIFVLFFLYKIVKVLFKCFYGRGNSSIPISKKKD